MLLMNLLQTKPENRLIEVILENEINIINIITEKLGIQGIDDSSESSSS